jgi:tryptophanyl-tRNA synthetase
MILMTMMNGRMHDDSKSDESDASRLNLVDDADTIAKKVTILLSAVGSLLSR